MAGVNLNVAHVIRAEDSNGDAVAGALLYVYEQGTTTAVTTYSDAALNTANAHPVVADAAGSWGTIYVPPGIYKIDVTDSGGTSLDGYPADDIAIPTPAGLVDLDTRTEVTTTNISSATNWIRTAGYATVGDGGGALYKSVGAEPSHSLKVQSNDGGWWELVPDSSGVSVKQAGAKGDDSNDDATAIQAVIDAQLHQTILFPDGTYLIGTGLTTSQNGHRFVGSGQVNGTSIKAKAASSLDYMLLLKDKQIFITGIQFDGNSDANDLLVPQNAQRSLVQMCRFNNAVADGIAFDLDRTTPTGNNNNFHIDSCVITGNGAVGVSVQTKQGNNNVIMVSSCEISGNTGHGLLAKGNNWSIVGGNFENNGGDGIKIGETADGTESQGFQILYPWLEANTGDGVNFEKAIRCIVLRSPVGGNDTVNDANNANVRIESNSSISSGQLKLAMGSDGRELVLQNNAVKCESGTDTDRTLVLTPKGAGLVQCDGPVHLPTYTVGTLPSASTARQLIYVSDETGGATLAFSDGTNFRRVQDRAIVS